VAPFVRTGGSRHPGQAAPPHRNIQEAFTMPRSEKKTVHKVVMTEGKRQIIHQLLQEYDIETAEDIQDALKDLLGGTLKEMLEAEMDDHLGYEKSERSDSDDYRNGYKEKTVNSSYGSLRIDVPQDRKLLMIS
jgi:putative transposase